jgi:hypothetical protein
LPAKSGDDNRGVFAAHLYEHGKTRRTPGACADLAYARRLILSASTQAFQMLRHDFVYLNHSVRASVVVYRHVKGI